MAVEVPFLFDVGEPPSTNIDHLSVSPSAVVDFSWTNSKRSAPPSENRVIDSLPFVLISRLLKISIDYNVLRGSVSDQRNVVDGQITASCG